MRLLPLIAVAELLAAPASTPMAAPIARAEPSATTVDPDLFCRRIMDGFREREERGNSRGNLAYAPLAPPPPPPPPPPAPPPSPGQVVITGSRVPQPNLTSVSPVTVVGSAELYELSAE